MRNDQEILDRIEFVEDRDWLGTQTKDLASRLPFDKIRHLLEETASRDDWGDPVPRDKDAVKAEMLDYMEFAWDKANGNRGLSAGRSLEHMSVWLWLIGMDAAAEQILDYDQYGKPWLRAICEHFEWDWHQWDDGRWTDDEMSDGHAAPETVPALAA